MVGLDGVYKVVDKEPSVKGGLGALHENVRYPERAARRGIKGRVYVQAVVNADGTVRSASIARGIGGGCDDEALRVVRDTEFTPAWNRRNGAYEVDTAASGAASEPAGGRRRGAPPRRCRACQPKRTLRSSSTGKKAALRFCGTQAHARARSPHAAAAAPRYAPSTDRSPFPTRRKAPAASKCVGHAQSRFQL
mgnify:CR=1 FL=1